MKDLVLSCLESRVENNQSLYARFLLAPFKNGNALTVGTALRRALLSQVEGIAITALDIQGITHEFCTIVGVRESVLELSLNFQKIVLRTRLDFNKAQVGYLRVHGPAVVYANDLKLPLGVECVDPTQHIATLSRDGLLVVKFLIAKGVAGTNVKINNSVLTANNIEQAKKALFDKNISNRETDYNSQSLRLQRDSIEKRFQSNVCLQNIIPLDLFCTPVNRANFTVQVDNLSNQKRERLLFEVWTNGTVHPRQAIQSAMVSLIALFSEFRTPFHVDSHSLGLPSTLSHQAQTNRSKRLSFLYSSNLDKMSLLSSDLSNFSLSLKTYMFLKQKGVNNLQALLEHSSNTLLQLVNGNKNMFYDIKRCVGALGLQLKQYSFDEADQNTLMNPIFKEQ